MVQSLSQCQEAVYLRLKEIAVEHQKEAALAELYPAKVELFQ
jgi:hypothetical protein